MDIAILVISIFNGLALGLVLTALIYIRMNQIQLFTIITKILKGINNGSRNSKSKD